MTLHHHVVAYFLPEQHEVGQDETQVWAHTGGHGGGGGGRGAGSPGGPGVPGVRVVLEVRPLPWVR